ncbi:hypothetical protein GOP47_0025852 [Adiantum capillus-veneris]|uniref:RING-type domain-containing protein n=1 Tax=Adiantum capillus-veneris TaxID=13818 RepID=A0A9D4U190_ADICA|nr:hypothetical protein GOP47_0025852 [Adiantum capillus-veneris]
MESASVATATSEPTKPIEQGEQTEAAPGETWAPQPKPLRTYTPRSRAANSGKGAEEPYYGGLSDKSNTDFNEAAKRLFDIEQTCMQASRIAVKSAQEQLTKLTELVHSQEAELHDKDTQILVLRDSNAGLTEELRIKAHELEEERRVRESQQQELMEAKDGLEKLDKEVKSTQGQLTKLTQPIHSQEAKLHNKNILIQRLQLVNTLYRENMERSDAALKSYLDSPLCAGPSTAFGADDAATKQIEELKRELEIERVQRTALTLYIMQSKAKEEKQLKEFKEEIVKLYEELAAKEMQMRTAAPQQSELPLFEHEETDFPETTTDTSAAAIMQRLEAPSWNEVEIYVATSSKRCREQLQENEKQLQEQRVKRLKESEGFQEQFQSIRKKDLMAEMEKAEAAFDERAHKEESELQAKQRLEEIKLMEEAKRSREKLLQEWFEEQKNVRKEKEQSTVEEASECATCFNVLNDQNRAILSPCGHARICLVCARKIFKSSRRFCPFCREKICKKPTLLPKLIT